MEGEPKMEGEPTKKIINKSELLHMQYTLKIYVRLIFYIDRLFANKNRTLTVSEKENIKDALMQHGMFRRSYAQINSYSFSQFMLQTMFAKICGQSQSDKCDEYDEIIKLFESIGLNNSDIKDIKIRLFRVTDSINAKIRQTEKVIKMKTAIKELIMNLADESELAKIIEKIKFLMQEPDLDGNPLIKDSNLQGFINDLLTNSSAQPETGEGASEESKVQTERGQVQLQETDNTQLKRTAAGRVTNENQSISTTGSQTTGSQTTDTREKATIGVKANEDTITPPQEPSTTTEASALAAVLLANIGDTNTAAQEPAPTPAQPAPAPAQAQATELAATSPATEEAVRASEPAGEAPAPGEEVIAPAQNETAKPATAAAQQVRKTKAQEQRELAAKAAQLAAREQKQQLNEQVKARELEEKNRIEDLNINNKAKKAKAAEAAAAKLAAEEEAAKKKEEEKIKDEKRLENIKPFLENIPVPLNSLRDEDLKTRIVLEAAKVSPFMDIKKDNFNVGNFKNASPNQILDLITTNKIDQYYDSIIGNNNKSDQLTPEKMKEALKSILLIRIIENIIYNKIKSYNNTKRQLESELESESELELESKLELEFKALLSQFIEYLRFRNVFPSNANIKKINEMIDELDDSINKNFKEAKNFMSLSLDIWYFVKDNKLNNEKNSNKINDLIKPITSALTEEGINEDNRRRENERKEKERKEQEREENERKEQERKEQEKRSRPVTRRSGRQRGGNKSKLNSTRKKNLKIKFD